MFFGNTDDKDKVGEDKDDSENDSRTMYTNDYWKFQNLKIADLKLKAKGQCWGLRPVHREVVHAQLDVQLQVFPLTEPENANLTNFVVFMIYSACLTTYDMVNKHCDDKTYECKFDQFCIMISCLMMILTTYDMVARKPKVMQG